MRVPHWLTRTSSLLLASSRRGNNSKGPSSLSLALFGQVRCVSASYLSSSAKMRSNDTQENSTNPLFSILRRESGQTESDLPIFVATPDSLSSLDLFKDEDKTISNDTTGTSRTEREIIPEVTRQNVAEDGSIFVLHNVVSSSDCDTLRTLSEQMGYTDDAPVSLGRHIRRNRNCVWVMDDRVNAKILQRTLPHLPESIPIHGGKVIPGPAVGLNGRWRFYQYGPGDVFRPHTDGAWVGSGRDAETGAYVHDTYDGSALSWLTFLLYLNDDFVGGATTFPNDFVTHHVGGGRTSGGEEGSIEVTADLTSPSFVKESNRQPLAVQPRKGSVLCFYHGYHPDSKLHEGSLVTNGTKYVARTDLLYTLPEEFRR